MDPQVAGQVLAALGLDVIDLHVTEFLDPVDLQALGLACRESGKVKAPLELRSLDRVDEADRIGEDAPVAGCLDAKSPASMAIGASIGLEPDPRVDTEPEQ